MTDVLSDTPLILVALSGALVVTYSNCLMREAHTNLPRNPEQSVASFK